MKQRDDFFDRTIAALTQAIENPVNDADAPNALLEAQEHLERNPDRLKTQVSKLVVMAGKHNTAHMRFAMAKCLYNQYANLTSDAREFAFSVLFDLTKDEDVTISFVDQVLSNLDMEIDRDKIAKYLSKLLSNKEQEIVLKDFSNLLRKIHSQAPKLIAWYSVYFLLSGKYQLEMLAIDFIGNNESESGFDLDLASFSLDDKWLIYLSHKVIGYGLIKPRFCAGVIVSVIRMASDDIRKCLRGLLFNPLVLNYSSLADHLKQMVSDETDTAYATVQTVIADAIQHEDSLKKIGTIKEMRPSEQERHTQLERQNDISRKIDKEVQKKSLLLSLIPKSTILYGNGIVSHINSYDETEPQRRVMQFTQYNNSIEIPLLEVFDPIGLHVYLFQCQIEKPPK